MRVHVLVPVLLLLLLDLLATFVILQKVPYTEIDWMAYMDEVESYVEGERDYLKIRGGTGPLVYPAFFLYVFRGLRYFAIRAKPEERWLDSGDADGEDAEAAVGPFVDSRSKDAIRKMQWFWVGFYFLNLLICYGIYSNAFLGLRGKETVREISVAEVVRQITIFWEYISTRLCGTGLERGR